jgi:perosamine synthetase
MSKLAVDGGSPVRHSFLPYGQQWLDEDDLTAVMATLKSDFITQGPHIARFEQALADYAGTKYALVFSSGTAALHAACHAIGIGPGDEVITSPITFVASSNCVLYQGGTPVFADIDANTYNISPSEIEQRITSRTKAIIAVDFSGQPAAMQEINAIAQRHGLAVIEDAAHSLGALYDGKKVGTLADMTMFSFHPVKHITTAEGGVIVTDNEVYYQKMQLFRSHGITRDTALLTRDDGPWYYEMHELGYHYRMTDIQASLGVSQLQKLDSFVARRREIAAIYQRELAGLAGLTLPYQAPLTNSSWHLFVVRFRKTAFRADKLTLFKALRAENIGVHVHYIPVYSQPFYARLGYPQDSCPNADQYYEEAMSLPIFPKMSDEDVMSVVEAVRKVYFDEQIGAVNHASK